MQTLRYYFSCRDTAANTPQSERIARARPIKYGTIRVIHPNHQDKRMEIREMPTHHQKMVNHFKKTLNLD